MPSIYSTIIEPVLEGSLEQHINFFRNICILKKHLACLCCHKCMSEVKCNKIKYKYVFKCGNSNCNKYKTTSIHSESFLDNGIDGNLIEDYLATFMCWDNVCKKDFQELVNLINTYVCYSLNMYVIYRVVH